MEKRVRSPNYPSMSLAEAIQRAALVYKNQHTHGAPREVVAKSMGYNSLNGASATSISALIKYGLLEGRGDEIKISDRAMCILHPQSPEEKAEAIRQAAREPELFRDLAERFPGRMPAEDVLRNYLIRNGFAPAAVSSVILAYRETCEFAEREAGAYDSGSVPVSTEAPAMHSTPQSHSAAPTPNAGKSLYNQFDERNVARYDFEGGGFVRISVGGAIETEQALSMAETLIDLKRKEIEARNEKTKNSGPVETNSGDEVEYDA
ncbi:MAG: hypothetical protein H5U13_01650 [Parvibaculum sp.]|nr:hypothetical protein [Parvibaculum sp.]